MDAQILGSGQFRASYCWEYSAMWLQLGSIRVPQGAEKWRCCGTQHAGHGSPVEILHDEIGNDEEQWSGATR